MSDTQTTVAKAPWTQQLARKRVNLIVVVGTFTIVLAYGVLGVRTGITVDNDSFAIIDSFNAILGGDYRPSRTSGYPMFEIVGAGAYGLAGVQGAMTLSLIATLSGLIILMRPLRVLNSVPGLLAWSALAITPVVMTNASAVMETSFLFLFVAVLVWLLSVNFTTSVIRSVALAAAAVALVLTRADAVLIVMATGLGLLVWWYRSNPRPRIPVDAIALSAAVPIGLAMLALITQRNPFSSSYLPPETLLRRLLRAGVGTFTFAGPVGLLATALLFIGLLLFALRCSRSIRSKTTEPPLSSICFITSWLLATAALYAVRYITLPDELEYLVPVLIVLAACVPVLFFTQAIVGSLALLVLWSSVATGVVSISLLDRNSPWEATPGIKVSLQPGAWLQDLGVRQAASVRATPNYQEFLRSSLGPLQSKVEAGTATVMPRNSWNFALNAGYTSFYDPFDSIIGCAELTSETLIPGWRISQPANSYEDLVAFENGEKFDCEVVAELTETTVTPVNSGLHGASRQKYVRP